MSVPRSRIGRALPIVEPPSMGTSGGPTASPSKPAEPDDPLALVGVPVPIDEGTFDEMADVFIDEFVRDGWPEDRLLAAFRSPFYAGLHVVWRRRGEAWVRARVAAAQSRWHRSADGGLADQGRRGGCGPGSGNPGELAPIGAATTTSPLQQA